MCSHTDGEGNQKTHGPVLCWLEPSWKLIFILFINTAKFHLNRAPKPVYVAGFRRPFSALFRNFLSTWNTVQAHLFSLYFIKEMHILPFLYLLWYIPTVNVWIWTSQKHQKSSLGSAAGQPASFLSLSTVQTYHDFYKNHLQTEKHTSTLSTFTRQREDTDQTENPKNGETMQRKAQHGKPGAGFDEPRVDRRALPLR